MPHTISAEANSVINSSLMISVFTQFDAGQYSCDVTNDAGNDTASFELVILGNYSLHNVLVCFLLKLQWFEYLYENIHCKY